MADRQEEAEQSSEEKEARRSVSGADRMTQNADIAESALSGSTGGRDDINYGMGEEGEPADSDGLRDRRSSGAKGGPEAPDSGRRSGSKGGGSRDRRSGGQDEPDREESQEQRSPGGGLRDRRSGGLTGDSGEDLKTRRTRRSSH